MDYSYEDLRIRFEEMKRDQRYKQVKTLAILIFATSLVAYIGIESLKLKASVIFLYPLIFNGMAWLFWVVFSFRTQVLLRSKVHSNDPRDMLLELTFLQRAVDVGLLVIDISSIASILSALFVISYPYIGP